MNEDTRISVHCYAGDAHQINYNAMLQHGCPVTILSPEDSKVVGSKSGVDYRFGGKRAYIGQDSLDRQVRHMEILLEYPENHFLMHDSDSLMLDPKIPDYLYAEPDIVWSNQVFDDIPEHQPYFPEGWPRVAFQPPYFLSRKTMTEMVQAAKDPRASANACMPFIDFFMVQLTVIPNLQWRRLNDCISCQITADPNKSVAELTPDLITHYSNGFRLATEAVLYGGCNVLHSVKDPLAAEHFLRLRQLFLAGNPNAAPKFIPGPHIGPRRNRQGRSQAFADPRGLKA